MPSQVPVVEVSSTSSRAVPETSGAVRLTGGIFTTAVETDEVAGGEEPASLEATTCTRTVEPTSAAVSV